MRLMGGAPGVSPYAAFAAIPVAAQGAEFETIPLMSTREIKAEFYNPQSSEYVDEHNLAGMAIAGTNTEGVFGGTIYYDENGRPLERVMGRRFYDQGEDPSDVYVPGEPSAYGADDSHPARLTVVPTSSSNPRRPRTVAAGYDKARQLITVIFRDGTFYNYYDVDPKEWQAFKSRVSKGQYIYKYLDFHRRGPADVSTIPSYQRTALYRIARSAQVFEGNGRGNQHDRNSRKQKRR